MVSWQIETKCDSCQKRLTNTSKKYYHVHGYYGHCPDCGGDPVIIWITRL